MSQNEILNLLQKKEGIISKEISKELSLAKSTVSKELSSLRKKNLIQFKKSENMLKIYKLNQ